MIYDDSEISKFQKLEKTLITSIFIKNTNSFEIKKQLDTILLNFSRGMSFENIDGIFQSKETTRLALKIFSNLQTLFPPRYREKIACDLFNVLLKIDKTNFVVHGTENLRKDFGPDLDIKMLEEIIERTNEIISEKYNHDSNPNFNSDLILDELALRKLYKFYLKFLLLIFFGHDEKFSEIEEILTKYILEFFCKLFEDSNQFANIISKQFLDLLYSRKIYSSNNLSINKVTSFFRNLIFNPKYKDLDLLKKIVKTFASYEDYKSKFSGPENKKSQNIFNFLHVFIERILSPCNYNFLETFYDSSRFNRIKLHRPDNYFKVSANNMKEFYDELKEICNFEKKMLPTFNLKENNFIIELEKYRFISLTKKSFDFEMNVFSKKFNFIKYIPNNTKIETIKQLLNNFDQNKYFIYNLLFDIYKKIYKAFDTETLSVYKRDCLMEDVEDLNYISLFQIKKILENPNNYKKLKKMFFLNKFEIKELFLITTNIITEINEKKENFCFTKLLPSNENILADISIPFLNFIMLLNKNKKILNKNSQEEIDQIFYSIFLSLPKLSSQNFDKQNLVVLYSFILNALASDQFKHSEIFKKIDSRLVTDLFSESQASRDSLVDDFDLENFKIFILNYIFNQVVNENFNLIENTIVLVITTVTKFLSYVHTIDNKNYKQYSNLLYTNLNYIKCALYTKQKKSLNHSKISFYDLYCRNTNCQKKIKRDRILIYNKFLYSCNWCGYFHIILNYEDEENISRNLSFNYEFIMDALKTSYSQYILDFSKFYKNCENDPQTNHVSFFRTFYLYLDFLNENWENFNFSNEEIGNIIEKLGVWKHLMGYIDSSFYQSRNLTPKLIKQTQKNVDAIKMLIAEILLNYY